MDDTEFKDAVLTALNKIASAVDDLAGTEAGDTKDGSPGIIGPLVSLSLAVEKLTGNGLDPNGVGVIEGGIMRLIEKLHAIAGSIEKLADRPTKKTTGSKKKKKR